MRKSKKINNKKHRKTKKICLSKKKFDDIVKESYAARNLYTNKNKYKLINTLGNISKIQKYQHKSDVYELYMDELNEIFKDSYDKKKMKYRPNDDFYSYINYEWLEKKLKKLMGTRKYFPQYDDFRVVQDKVYNEVIDLTLNYCKNHDTEKSRSIKNLYDSFRNTTVKEALHECNDVSKQIDSILNKEGNDYIDMLIFTNLNEIYSWGSPLEWNVLPDEKNVKKNISHLSPGRLTINDYTVYIELPTDRVEERKYKKELKDKYIGYIHKIFSACTGSASHGYNPQDIIDVEYEMLLSMGSCTKYKDDPNYYNVVTKTELEKNVGFDWTKFTKGLGYDKVPEKVIISSVNAVSCLNELVKKNWNTPKWRTYWHYMFYRQIIRFQNDLRSIHFEFVDKFINGIDTMMPDKIYPIFGLSFTYNTLLTDLYYNKYKNEEVMSYVNSLGNDLRQVFIRQVTRNDWLQKKTKEAALSKLKNLKLIIGKPETLRYDPVMEYTNKSVYTNMHKLGRWKRLKYIELEGKTVVDIPEIDWKQFKLVGTQAYMVNAYYRPTSNSIYVPLAYMQKPFIDLDDRGIEYNLAYIGFTLGHELSHCLDDMGSKFDENGNLNNWWSDEDRKKFKKKIKEVVRQYEEFAARDGIKFDAEIGVGEDLADISGLDIIEEYLLDFQIVNNNIPVIKEMSLEALYIYIAIASRQIVKPQALSAQLKNNPHPLEKYRVNVPLSRSKLFKIINNVKKGDGMWWPTNDTIW